MLLRAYRVQYGLDATALRISYVYGPGRRTSCAIRSMLTNALKGRPTALSWGAGHARAYLHVEDAARGVVAALDAPMLRQAAYNIADTTTRTMDAIAALVRDLVPGARITLAPGANPLGYERDVLDVSAAKQDLGWAPQVGLEQGLAGYLAWMREQPESLW